jgi:glycosyltransferase involved in cell wall biosynthesis
MPPHIAVNTRLFLPGKTEGISRFAEEVLRRMVNNHPEVKFSFFFDRKFDERFIFGPNVQPYVIPPQSRHPILWYLWFHVQLPKYLKKLKADLFFSPELYLSSYREIPQIPVMHDLAYEHSPEDVGKMASAYLRHFSPIYASWAEKILTVSDFSKQDIVKLYGIEPEKIELAYNGCSEVFQALPPQAQEEVRQKYSGGKPYFLFVGTLNPRKNIESLLEAFDLFKENDPGDHLLLIAGRKGWKYQKALNVYESMKFKDSVHFTGFVEDDELSRLYAAARAFVFVPHLEGFGIPLLEAMQCQTAIICGDNSALPEVVGKAALKVGATDIPSLARSMEKLAKDESLRANLIAEGIRQKEKFSWQQTYERVWSAISQVLGSSSAPSS